MAAPLIDGFGRAFSYLRLSVEDACNFRCLYCLPNGYAKDEKAPPLSVEEVRRLVAGFAGMGLWKVRLTGGEPTVRRDILDLASAVALTPGVRKLSLSTNGYRLVELAAEFQRVGVTAVNVSVDSLDRARFEQVTGHDKLPAVLAGVERCLELGLETKVNAVLMKELNDGELDRFLDWTKHAAVGVRFIELMPTTENLAFFQRRHVTAESLIQKLSAEGWREEPRKEGDGPARRFRRKGRRGTVGVIAPYSKDFCASCNRLRVTSRGDLRLCLFAEQDACLRHLLRRDDQLGELQSRIRALVNRKEAAHYLPEGRFGNTRNFAVMGG